MLPDVVTLEVQASRTPNYDIAPLLLDRWSPRSMTAESLTDEELFPLFEADRWAPSSFNVPRRAHTFWHSLHRFSPKHGSVPTV